jgi:predicted small metal-binding protein
MIRQRTSVTLDRRRGADMPDHTIECPCGTVLRAETLDEVVEEARGHARTVHDMDLSEDDARSMSRPGS